MKPRLKVAICGAGIGGPTLAYWLHRFGHEPVLIEKSPQLRAGGYVVDFWGIGYDIAEKMGLLDELKRRGYFLHGIRWVNSRGNTSGMFSADAFRKVTKGRYVSLERSDLSASIFGASQGRVETIFGDTIAAIDESARGVRVTFDQAAPREFDLVVGADGLHSRVRELAFGPMQQFEQDLGFRVAAFEATGYRPRDEDLAISHTVPGRQVMRFSKRDDKTMFFFGFANRFETGGFPETDEQRKATIERAFAGIGWECPQILAVMRDARDLFYDRASQIHLPHWTRGRVALVGDAGAAVSLLAGEGAGLAMAESYVLAGELARAGDNYATAFARYEERLMPFLRQKQTSALRAAGTIVPKSWLGIILRNLVTNLLPGSLVARLGLASLVDDVELPAYEAAERGA